MLFPRKETQLESVLIPQELWLIEKLWYKLFDLK